jgi:hypothetical protein
VQRNQLWSLDGARPYHKSIVANSLLRSVSPPLEWRLTRLCPRRSCWLAGSPIRQRCGWAGKRRRPIRIWIGPVRLVCRIQAPRQGTSLRTWPLRNHRGVGSRILAGRLGAGDLLRVLRGLHTSSELPHLYAIWPLVASIAVKSGSSLMKFGYVDPQMTVQASHDLATRTRLLIRDASPTDRAKVRMRSSTGEILPAMVITASTTATTTIQISVNRISLRRSTMSPIGPGRESQNKERQSASGLHASVRH